MKKTSKARKAIKITVLSILGVIAAALIIISNILYGRVSTISSVKQLGEGMYTVNYRHDYQLDKALESGIDDERSLLKFICDEMYFGYQVDSNIEKYACSVFLTESPDGDIIAGRNFDYDQTDTLAVYTKPYGGYASISMAVLDFMKVGRPNAVSPMSIEGKLAMLAAPYLCVDGVNEAGLNIALLDLPEGEIHQDNGKPDLFMPIAVRLLLDRAATVDEAAALLEQYDIHCADGNTQHMFISDKSGRAVVVEWGDDDMTVVESDICTNFWLKDTPEEEYPQMCDRFDIIQRCLKNNPANTEENSMKILDMARVGWTQWSCVYNLSDFSVDVAVDLCFDNVYTLSPESFK